MKRIILVLILVLFSVQVCAEEITLIFGLEKKSDEYQGALRLAAAIETRIGIKVNLRSVPIKRMYVELTKNKDQIDGGFTILPGLEKKLPHLIKVPEPVLESPIVCIGLYEIPINGWESLRGYKTCYLMGLKSVEQNIIAFELDGYPLKTTEAAFSFVLADRAKVFITPVAVVVKAIKSKFFLNSGLKILKPPVAVHSFHTYLHEKHAGIAEKYNTALKALKREGEYQKLVPHFYEYTQNQ